MTKREIATVCHAIEALEETTDRNTINSLFTDEAMKLFDVPVFDCILCDRKVSYNDLVDADESEIEDIVDGCCHCADCIENNSIYGYNGNYIDGFADLFSDAINILNELKTF